MDQATLQLLRDQSAAWRLLRASSSVLILAFLGEFFVTANRGATPASVVANRCHTHRGQRGRPGGRRRVCLPWTMATLHGDPW